MEKYAGKDRAYRKDFAGWAKVAEEVERRGRRSDVKCGAVYWCNIGEQIGSELTGKGADFTRPVLVIAKLSDRIILVAPFTSAEKTGRNYIPIRVCGRIDYLAIQYFQTIDILRLGNFMDDLPPETFRFVKRELLQFIKRYLYKES